MTASGGNAPNGTVPSHDNCELFVCKAAHQEQWVSGHMNPPENVCAVPFGGKGHSYGNYQVLVNNIPVVYNLDSVNYLIPSAKISFSVPILLATKVVENLSNKELEIVDYITYEKMETRHWQHTYGTRKGVRYESSAPVPALEHTDPHSGKIVLTNVTSYNGTWDHVTEHVTHDVTAAVVTIPPHSSRSISVLGEVGTLRLNYEATLNLQFQGGRKIAKEIKGYFVGTQIYSEIVVVSDPVLLNSK